jgi:hypothetical protein
MNKKYSNIDDLFRDKFNDFELDPPDHIWENIKQHVHGTGKSGGSFSNGGIIGITILLILTSLFTFYLLQGTSGKEAGTEKTVTDFENGHSIKSTPRSVQNIYVDPLPEADQTAKPTDKDFKSKNKIKTSSRFELSTPGRTQQGKSSLTVTDPVWGTENSSLTEFMESNQNRNSEIPGSIQSIVDLIPGDDSELLALNNSDNGATVQNDPEYLNKESEPLSETAPDIRSDYGKENNWSFGLFFTPELVYYPSATEFNSRSYSLDLNAIYSFSGYLIQSGIGVGFSSDNGNYKIDYNKYLGSYQDVYNITFDTTGGQAIPIYHTETVKVYDSIDHITISPTKRKFTYLNIPVLFGYGNEGRKFGWFVKAGPSLSLLIHENIPDINLTDSQNKILRTGNDLPGRSKTNWQFVFIGGASYKLTNTLNFTIEPVFRYYIKPTYEQYNTELKTPWSIGIRTGFVLGF